MKLLFVCSRTLSSSCVLMKERFIIGKSKHLSPTELRGKVVDESDNIEANIGALTSAQLQQEVFKTIETYLKLKPFANTMLPCCIFKTSKIELYRISKN